MKTYYGIFLDLEESTYIADIDGFKFYFSSEATMKKFFKRIYSYQKEALLRIKTSYNVEIEDSLFFFAFSLYSLLEKRGFHVEYWNGEKKVKTFEEKPKFEISCVSILE